MFWFPGRHVTLAVHRLVWPRTLLPHSGPLALRPDPVNRHADWPAFRAIDGTSRAGDKPAEW
jgi:hypothetical protein